MKALLTRKFLLAVVGIIVTLLAFAIPDFRPHAPKIGELAFALVGVAILGIALEDSAKAWANRPTNVANAIADVADEAFDTVINLPTELEETLKKAIRETLAKTQLAQIPIGEPPIQETENG